MPVEIERKFLVVGDGWTAAADEGREVRQANLARTPRGKVRVRIAGCAATLTIKSRRRGLTRDEFTYPIPLADAEHMLACLRATPVIAKLRHRVPHAGLVWHVDVYRGSAAGLVVAEVELDREDQPIDVPEWAGPEVTHDLRYHDTAIASAMDPASPAKATEHIR